ncbi:Protein of unknown function (DUF998) [Micromonospora matsumotoense]|uniref:DUF998 domain-containing protein n=1 Tax=Micromonospora matsumotoense TaxID=121616 RepID=A0A1C4YIQ2_9ACTN|nr:DUF998 domain-containing protein [Micromonospora matsumotoense]SCF20613.1 Protein of unknown function (DUF998) [Micromonospora matsumotoense]
MPDPVPGRVRTAAGWAAAGCVLAGTVAVTVAVAAGPGLSSGYVSEAGVTGSAFASTYRMGVFVLAAALLSLAAALPAALRIAAGLLVAGAAGAVLSGAVTCSAGCPLPPFEAATPADLVHAGASIAAAGATVLAMLVVGFLRPATAALRRVARGASVVALPVAVLVALGLLTVGRGALVGGLERLLLAVCLGWGLVTALLLTRPRPDVPAALRPGADRPDACAADLPGACAALRTGASAAVLPGADGDQESAERDERVAGSRTPV